MEQNKDKIDKFKKSCHWCGKNHGRINLYVITDVVDTPRPFHEECVAEFKQTLITDEDN